MTRIRPVRLAFSAACLTAFSFLALMSTSILAQENSGAAQIHQACLEHLNSWIFKDCNSDSCPCETCVECGEQCANTPAPECSPQQEGLTENEAWTQLWIADEDEPSNESCQCTLTFDRSEGFQGKLGIIRQMMESGDPADNCDCQACQPECCQMDCCSKLNCGECELCDGVGTMPEKSAYCKDMAELLCTTLNGSEMGEPAMQKVIEKAMMLVARNAQSESQIAMAQMQAKHEQEKAEMRGQLVQLSTQIHTVNDLRNWIGPLYTNQNRTIQHMQMMSASSYALNRTLSLLEKQLSNNATASPTTTNYSGSRVVQADSTSEVYNLKQQISELQQQLHDMQRTQTDKVQPAQHLEPIYNSNQRLEPLESPPFPESMNWSPKPRR